MSRTLGSLNKKTAERLATAHTIKCDMEGKLIERGLDAGGEKEVLDYFLAHARTLPLSVNTLNRLAMWRLSYLDCWQGMARHDSKLRRDDRQTAKKAKRAA